MRHRRLLLLVLPLCCFCLIGALCDTGAQDVGDPATLVIPDGIDPKNPGVERTTYHVDFSGIRLIRLELATGRIAISQSADGSSSLRVIETILADGHSNDAMKQLLSESFVTAQRSFVDPTRLDIKSQIAAGLSGKDIEFEIRLITPISAGIEIFADHAPVEIISLDGNVEIQTGGGEIVLDRVFGNVVAKTSKSSIEASNITGHVQLVTAGAPITLRLAPQPGISVSATTNGAPIRIAIDRATAAAIDLATVNGVIFSDLTGFIVSDVATGEGFLRGVLNGGGGRIEGRTTGTFIEFLGM